MVSTSHLGRALTMGALAFVASSGALVHAQPTATPRPGERDHLTVEGVPPPDPLLAARLERYQHSRQASFLDWLPGGGMLLGTRFGATQQVHRVLTALGDREQLTFYSESVTMARATARGDGFLFVKDQGGDEASQVYYYTGQGSVRQLTQGKFVHGGPVLAHDGKRVAFYGADRDGVDRDVYVADLTSQDAPRMVGSGQSGLWQPLDWSLDDRQLLVLRSVSGGESDLYLADVSTGALTPLVPADPASGKKIHVRGARFAPGGRGIYLLSDETGEFAQLHYLDPVARQERAVSPELGWDVEDFAVSGDGRYVAYSVNEDGKSRLALADTLSKTDLISPELPIGRITNLEFDRTGHRLALSVESAQAPRDVYVYDLDKMALERWTRSEAGPLDPSTLVAAELVHYPTWDRVNGRQRAISAYVYRPRTNGPCPVLISIHGGPADQYRPGWEPFFQFLVNELGYAVIAPNVRGSAGYGKSFLTLDDGMLRQDAVRDIGSLLVWIGLQPAFDRQHIAVMGGGAYGGYMALASLAAYGDRLRGGIDVLGISSFVTFLNSTAEPKRAERRAEYGDERDPKMRAYLDRISPLNNIARIRQPVLIVQGGIDGGPLDEAQQMAWRLRNRGDEVWYVTMKDAAAAKGGLPPSYLEAAAQFLKKLSAANVTATASP
jgi:dipeptidyl aminopeptidase/acylaminoacyl peptidase